MQSSPSLASLSSNASSTSSHSSSYGSRTVLDASDLPSASARCRSSIVSFLDNDDTLFASPPPPPPPRRRSHMPTTTMTRSTPKCRHLFRTCLSSTSSPLSIPVQSKLSSSSSVRQRYFAQLCQSHRLLLVLTDYDCRCGCHFSMRQGAFVVLYESNDQPSSKKREEGVVTVISSDLVCSKVPLEHLCDVDVLRERVRARQLYDEQQSFDL